jgi:4-hydroxy-tetrahydrodipicolinate synthase
MTKHPISGVFAAAITPLNDDFSVDVEAIPQYLGFLAERGCHGALLLGTTGEGPSFDAQEKHRILKAAKRVQEAYPDFILLAGTGTPSLSESIALTRTAFDIGYDGVVCLPPYYYHQATVEGLYIWFENLIRQAVPPDGYLLGYHIPAQSGVPLPFALLRRLKNTFPQQFAGIKDSSADPEHTLFIGDQFGSDFVSLVGSDALLLLSLENHGAGCITALANLYAPELRTIWDAFERGEQTIAVQERLVRIREVLQQFAPYPPLVKGLLAALHNQPAWAVKPPLGRISPKTVQMAIQQLSQIF